jgi:hypothetical protein
VVPHNTFEDQELIALALETMYVANGVPDAAIRCELQQIAEDVLRLAWAVKAPN